LLYTVLVLRAPRRPVGLARVTFLMSQWVNEYPFVAFAALAASTVLVLVRGDLTSARGWVLLGVAAATALGLVHVARRAWLAGPVVEDAPADQFGGAWRAGDGGPAGARPLSRFRVVRDVLAPFRCVRGPSSGSATLPTARRAGATFWTCIAAAMPRPSPGRY
jgi:hypothetical protein